MRVGIAEVKLDMNKSNEASGGVELNRINVVKVRPIS